MGLMSAALIGTIILQAYWINWHIRLEEDRFYKMALMGLNHVADKLENVEDIEETSLYRDKFQSNHDDRFYQRLNSGSQVPTTDDTKKIAKQVNELEVVEKDALGHRPGDSDCDCTKCTKEKLEKLEQFKRRDLELEQRKMLRFYNPQPIVERIKLKHLDTFLKKEFARVGIDLEYNYGVYSNEEKSFVIRNNHYIVELEEEKRPQVVTAGFNNLWNSKYRVELFPSTMTSPGQLVVHFPAKASLVLSSIWKSLLSSILFTGLTLFCFAYTLRVIFQQKKISEMKTDFINNMTHEFKTPIATISLAADSITSPMISGNADKVRRFADIIKQENKRMNSQVEKVLQMALIDKRDFDLNLMMIDVHNVINQIISNGSLRVEKKGGTLKADLKAENPNIEGDLTHISNIIHNLVDNAYKYSKDIPEISIHTRNVKEGLEVIVEDKGIGMSKEARKLIFDRFYRVHTGDLHDVKGFGLGLSYVKAIVMAHKGEIEVKSELGKGSSFILYLPFKVEGVE